MSGSCISTPAEDRPGVSHVPGSGVGRRPRLGGSGMGAILEKEPGRERWPGAISWGPAACRTNWPAGHQTQLYLSLKGQQRLPPGHAFLLR